MYEFCYDSLKPKYSDCSLPMGKNKKVIGVMRD